MAHLGDAVSSGVRRPAPSVMDLEQILSADEANHTRRAGINMYGVLRDFPHEALLVSPFLFPIPR